MLGSLGLLSVLLRVHALARDLAIEQCRCSNVNDPCWPDVSSWALLNSTMDGRLIVPTSPLLDSCTNQFKSAKCQEELNATMSSPLHISNQPGAYQSAGWNRGWVATPSTYAVAAASIADVQAAVVFAVQHNLRLVVKGSGHDYLGRSSTESNGSLLVWTRRLNNISFASDNRTVTVGAGVLWDDLFVAVQSRGRFVIGGGCATVGAAGGFPQGGGFGILSKAYGTAADNVVEITLVTANGDVVTANNESNPDIFWAMRGGGGGTFGIVISLTYRTWPAPKHGGFVGGHIKCPDMTSLHKVLTNLMYAMSQELLSENWGWELEGVQIGMDYIDIEGWYVDITVEEAKRSFAGFVTDLPRSGCDWDAPKKIAKVARSTYPNETTMLGGLVFFDLPKMTASSGAQIAKWYPLPFFTQYQDGHWYSWSSDASDANFLALKPFWTGYLSRYLPMTEFKDSATLAHKLASLATSNIMGLGASHFTLRTNKGLAGGNPVAWSNTSYNPAARTAGALIVVSTAASGFIPQLPDDMVRQMVRKARATMEPSIFNATFSPEIRSACVADEDENGHGSRCWGAMRQHLDEQNRFYSDFDLLLKKSFPSDSGSYSNEGYFFEPDWQTTFWGANYPKLLQIKAAVDPDGLFVCHHCVGSEYWSSDGNCRVQTKSEIILV